MTTVNASLIAISLAGGVAFTAAASAGDMSSANNQLTPKDPQDYSRLDLDGDGYISKREAQTNPSLAEKFETLDSNQDQRVDEGEFARFEAIESGDSDTRIHE
ncbi:hypothetical protein Tel_13300 [Candidatus Tenderia electrophaga]|jgi:hypothetical protein|uniref:EF-hand domain-containing protein n=1 Tax=Candidatus Tenderia electrophaga TaxID=1748243 RepID=A0A0S2TFV3_9GAMM|nr:hypothetical protein Tel_13300 [Candidatus Tenderia electrophaga]